MVEQGEVEVQFCNIEKQSRFRLSEDSGAVFVFPDIRSPLKSLTVGFSKYNNTFHSFRKKILIFSMPASRDWILQKSVY